MEESLIKRLEKLEESKKEENLPKIKKLKIPRKAKVKKSRIKKGWIGIITINENGNISGERQKVEDSTVRLKDGTYHAISGNEILFWEGKFPVIILQTWKKNPLNLIRKEGEKNGTSGQKYIMARMLGDTIKVKGKGALPLVWIIGLAIAGYIGYSLLTGTA